MQLKTPASHSTSATPSKLCRVRFLVWGATSVDLRFVPAVEAALRVAAVVWFVAGLREALWL